MIRSPDKDPGREGAIDRFSMITTGLAPHFTVEDLIAEGDRVVVRWTNAGTHVGDFAGIPATGRPFTIAGIDIYRLAGGQLCEHWHVIDQLGMLGQLRLLPQGAEGPRSSPAPIDARASAAGPLASINA
jgi:predicted SnoaL-like aldol condensation-catalyzing enzyme